MFARRARSSERGQAKTRSPNIREMGRDNFREVGAGGANRGVKRAALLAAVGMAVDQGPACGPP